MKKVPKLRFKEFSNEWEEKRLGEIGEIIGGGTPSSIIEEYWNGNIQWFTPSEIGKNKYVNKSLRTITKEGLENSSAKLLPKGTILLSSRATIGEKSIALGEVTTNQGFQSIFVNEKNYNEFIYYLLDRIKPELIKKSTGSTFLEISNKTLKEVYIKVTILEEQEKIANFLSSIDKKISLIEEKLELFREYKKGVMQKIFSQELRFKDSEGNDYPEWEEKRLEEVTECLDNLRKPLNSNEREKIKGNIPYYGANGIQGYINNYIFNEELVLLAEDGGNFDDYLTKPIAQYVQGKSWINNHAHVLKGKKVLKTKFLYFSLVHKDIRSFINGTSRSKLNKSNMLNIIILLPTVEEQHKIADFLSSIDSKIESIEKELERLKEFKKGLLQQMFV